ncbi:TetR/AcrR family transcriptional regulator [Nocardioides pacificus]
MTESATTREGRREATKHRISVCAQKLTQEHGLEGFTMEDLGEAAGVSRRTLFNYYPSKLDAVLGVPPEFSPESVERFRARGAGSNLVHDLRDLCVELLDDRELTREDVARTRCILLATPRLLAAAHDRFVVLSGQIVEEIRQREGAGFDAQRAQIAVRLIAGLFDSALEMFLTDPLERDLATAYDNVLNEVRQLLA